MAQKISIDDNAYAANVAAIKAIPEASISVGDVRVILATPEVFVVRKLGSSTTELPDKRFQADDAAADSKLWWVSHQKAIRKITDIVGPGYDFVGNSKLEVTDIALAEIIVNLFYKITTPKFRYYISAKETLDELIWTKMTATTIAEKRDQVKWDLLTTNEKSIAAHWFSIRRESFFTEVVNDDDYWRDKRTIHADQVRSDREDIVNRSKDLIQQRVESPKDALQTIASFEIVPPETSIPILANDLLQTFKIRNFWTQFIDGIEGEGQTGGLPSIKEYLNGDPPFDTGNGFQDLGYTLEGSHTWSSLATEIIDMINQQW